MGNLFFLALQYAAHIIVFLDSQLETPVLNHPA